MKSPFPWFLISLALLALTLFRFAGTQGVNYDDVFIALVYAKHLLASGGFYWNVQDGSLDGFTSLLDLLLKALASAIHPQDRLAAAWWLNLLLHCAIPPMGMALVASLQEGVAGWRRFLAPTLAGLLLAGNESLAVSASSLLEGPAFVLLTLMGLWLALRPRSNPLALVPVLCLLPLARPEGAGVALLLALWQIYSQRGERLHRRLYPLSGFLLFLGLYAAWRIHTFGHWAPNTYYAKTSDNRWNELADGWAYLWAYAHTPAGALICATVALLPLLWLSGRWVSPVARSRFLLLALLGVAMTGAVVVEGGDSYDGSRFMVLTAALGIVTLAVGFAGLTGRRRWAPLGMLLALLGVQSWVDLPNWEGKWTAVQRQWPVGERFFECDRWVAGTLSPLFQGLTVAQSDFQMFKYFADDIQVIDLHGLNDREIAHRPFSGPVKFGKFRVENGLERRPAIWFFGSRIGATEVLINKAGMRAALTDPAIYWKAFGYTATGAEKEALIENYRPVSMPCGKQVYNFLLEKGQVPRLRAMGMPIGGQ